MPAVSVEYRNMYYPETELSTRCCLLVTKKCGTGKGPINAAITKIMELDKWQENTNIVNVIDNINVERVRSFQYLGAMFTANGDGASNIKQLL